MDDLISMYLDGLMGNEECLHIMYMILYMWLLIQDTTVNWPANCAMTAAVILLFNWTSNSACI